MLGVVIDDTESADRVRAQQSLNAQLAKALELARVSVWRIDLQAQRIHINETGFGFNGLMPRAEGLSLDEMRALVHPDDLPAALRATEQAVAAGGVVDLETRYLHADGRYRHLLTRRVAEHDDQGRAIALTGVSLDQSEQVAERERAQRLARRIQLVAEVAGVGVWSIENPGEGAAEQVEWNTQMFHIYGLPQDKAAPPVQEWMGRRVHVDDRQRVADERRRARRAGKDSFETSFRIVQPDGSLRWVVCRSHRDQRDGRTVLHGIHLDVTQQRALDQTLRLQEQRLQLATQIAGVGIWDRDLATEQVIWEEQMYRLRGLGSDDPRTPRAIDEQIMTPQALAERRQRIQRHLEDAEPYAYEFEVRWPDGSTRWLASTGSAVRDDTGRAGAHGRAELGRHPAPPRRGGIARRRGGRTRQPRQVGVPGAHEPRTAHAAERHARLCAVAAARPRRAAGRRAAGAAVAYRLGRHAPAVADRRGAGPERGRGRLAAGGIAADRSGRGHRRGAAVAGPAGRAAPGVAAGRAQRRPGCWPTRGGCARCWPT